MKTQTRLRLHASAPAAVAIPDAFFKIVTKEGTAPGHPGVPASTTSQHSTLNCPLGTMDFSQSLESQLSPCPYFLQKLSATEQAQVEGAKAKEVWK